MKFTQLMCDASYPKYGGTLISKKLNNGEFDYWLVIEVIDWEDATGDVSQGKWCVSLCSVSPSEAGESNLKAAFECCGVEDDAKVRANPIVQVECLKSYGVYAQLWSSSGNNFRELMKQAHKEAEIAAGLYGFYMDRPENRIGSTGWEMQRGDLSSAMNRIKGD
jgi:hypothetical protein